MIGLEITMNHWLASHGEVDLNERPQESRYGVKSSLSINLTVKRYGVNFLKKIEFSLANSYHFSGSSKMLFWKLILTIWSLKGKWVASYFMFPVSLYTDHSRQNHRDNRTADQLANIYILFQCYFCYVGLPVKINHYSSQQLINIFIFCGIHGTCEKLPIKYSLLMVCFSSYGVNFVVTLIPCMFYKISIMYSTCL